MSDASAIIANAQGYASSSLSAATAAMDAASGAIDSMPRTVVSYNPPVMPSYEAPEALAPYVQAPDVTWDAGNAPTLTPLQEVDRIDAGSAPVLNAAKPTLTPPTLPAGLAAFLNRAPSVSTNISFPSPPDALSQTIAEPVIATRAEPVKPQTTLPGFSAVVPTDTTVAPTNLDTQFDTAYRSISPQMAATARSYVDQMIAQYNPQYATQMAAIETQLQKYLDGGTGLKPEIEDAIYSRARAKNDAEARRVIDSAAADAAARGFSPPSGALASSMARARQEAANNNAKTANEIAIAQAEMEQKNLQFAVTTSSSLRTAMLNAAMSYMQNLTQINGQALDYAKSLLSSVIEVYNAQVRAYTARLEGYKAQAQVYETTLKASLAGVELYKVEIEALQAMTKVDISKVEVYKARMESLSALANAYQSNVAAIQGRANLEKLKLDVFQAEVQAYTAQVQGKNAEWQGYTAAINGNLAQAQMYQAEVQAYTAQVNGYKAAIEGKAEAVKAAAMSNEAIARQNSAALESYRVIAQTKGEVARTKVENARLGVMAYEANARAVTAHAASYAEYYKAIVTSNVQFANLGVSTALKSAEMDIARSKAVADVASSNGRVYAGLSSAAMSGMTALGASIISS